MAKSKKEKHTHNNLNFSLIDMGKSKGSFALFTGAVFGAALGVAAGMLLAPQAGKKTREEVKDSLDKIAKKGKEMLKDYEKKLEKTDMNEVVDTAKAKVKSAAEDIKSSIKFKVKK